MEFSRQENCSGLPFPSPGHLPDPGIEPVSLVSPALASSSLPLHHLLVFRFLIHFEMIFECDMTCKSL